MTTSTKAHIRRVYLPKPDIWLWGVFRSKRAPRAFGYSQSFSLLAAYHRRFLAEAAERQRMREARAEQRRQRLV